MKGFIEVEKIDGSRMTIAVEHIAEIHDGTPCCICTKIIGDWGVRQTYEEVLCLITKAMKEGGE